MNVQLTVGSLFSGIGGFDLGLERAGMRTVWFCEQDDFCQRVLAKHWPGIPIHDDVCALMADTARDGADQQAAARTLRQRTGSRDQPSLNGHPLSVQVSYVDVLCGGFPCQDLSYAGKGAGLNGTRSGLWSEYARLIGELRPRYVIVENVAALLARGLSRVLGDLAALGYDAEWDCIPASAVGAPHRRDRVWLIAYPNSQSEPYGAVDAQASRDATDAGWADVGNANRLAGATVGSCDRECGTMAQPGAIQRTVGSSSGGWDHWLVEPDVGRVANGIPQRVDRLRSLGNALVPQIAELIGQRIIAYEEAA